MSEHDLSKSVDQARHELRILLVRMQQERTAPGPPEVTNALANLLVMLDKLQTRLELLREILTQTSGAVFAKDRAGLYEMINPLGAQMFGKSVEEILGRDDTALFDSEGAARMMAIDRDVMSTGSPRTFEDVFVIQGVPTTLLTTQTPWYEPRGSLRGLIGSAQDVTERKRVERGALAQQHRLRSLATEIVMGEERLRQALAADLHSGLGQDIALTKMKLAALRTTSSVDLHDALAVIEGLVERADRSLRSITFQLSPPTLHDLGLVPALQWLAENFAERSDLEVWIDAADATEEADDPMRVLLFRAVRELLTNIATHAGVHEAHVRIGSKDGMLRISVEDRGAGFDALRVDLQGYGLFGIREQVRHAGGDMHIDSTPGSGTTVSLTVPLAVSSAATI